MLWPFSPTRIPTLLCTSFSKSSLSGPIHGASQSEQPYFSDLTRQSNLPVSLIHLLIKLFNSSPEVAMTLFHYLELANWRNHIAPNPIAQSQRSVCLTQGLTHPIPLSGPTHEANQLDEPCFPNLTNQSNPSVSLVALPVKLLNLSFDLKPKGPYSTIWPQANPSIFLIVLYTTWEYWYYWNPIKELYLSLLWLPKGSLTLSVYFSVSTALSPVMELANWRRHISLIWAATRIHRFPLCLFAH